MRSQSGLTLIELLLAVAIAGLLLVLGVPAFEAMQARRAADAALAAMVSDLALARSEAVKRGHSVTVCPSADGSTCLDGTEWRQGWLLYTNPPAATLAPATPAAPAASAVLRVQAALPGIQSIDGTRSAMTFRPSGIAHGLASHLQVIPAADPARRRLLCISNPGRVSLQPEGTRTCGS